VGKKNRFRNLEKADSLLQTTENPSIRVQGQVYHHWGQYYKERKDFAQAYPYLTRAISVLQPHLAKQRLARIQVADYHTTYAQALKDNRQHDSALFHLERAFQYYQSDFSQRLFYIYFERADNYFLLGDTAAFFREAQHLIASFQRGEASTARSLPELLQKDLEIYPDMIPVKVMLRLADRFWELYQQYPTEDHLQLATAAFSQLDRWYGPYIQENLRLTALEAEYRSWIYKGLLRSYAESYRRTGNQEALARAFEASERNKGFSLRRHLRQQSLLSYAGLPDSMVARDAAFRAQIAFLSAHLKRLQFQAEAPKEEDRYQEKLLVMQESYDAFLQKLKTDFPEYVRLLDQQPVSIEQFQQSLQRDQHGLIYARADSVLFIFHISRDLAAIQRSPLPANLEDQIQRYRSFLHDYHPSQYAAVQDSLQILGQQFQDLFLATGEEWNAGGTASLLCIPDDVLSFLPFEVLPGLTPEFPFLVNQYPIGYAYSASLFVDQQNHRPSSQSPRLAAFAPSYQEDLLASLNQSEAEQMRSLVREGWFDLQGARQEASAIVSRFEGDLIQGQSASKDTFLRLAPQYQILHLAMHASVKPQTPLLSSLIFAGQEAKADSSKRMLFATDLLPLRLKADLVVLSACNTGYGKIKAGEGAESLAKAFHYAGSPAVVMSLWKVPDRETRVIMEAFYRYLHEGRNKAEALREAKLDYLKQVKAPEMRHPFFWAGFVLSGNAEPLPDGAFPWWGYALILLGMMAIFLFARKQLNRR
jgi:CHAT domain-containing protein